MELEAGCRHTDRVCNICEANLSTSNTLPACLSCHTCPHLRRAQVRSGHRLCNGLADESFIRSNKPTTEKYYNYLPNGRCPNQFSVLFGSGPMYITQNPSLLVSLLLFVLFLRKEAQKSIWLFTPEQKRPRYFYGKREVLASLWKAAVLGGVSGRW